MIILNINDSSVVTCSKNLVGITGEKIKLSILWQIIAVFNDSMKIQQVQDRNLVTQFSIWAGRMLLFLAKSVIIIYYWVPSLKNYVGILSDHPP